MMRPGGIGYGTLMGDSGAGCCRGRASVLGNRTVLWVEASMTYVVTEACIKCKYTDCVEVCPVDCFYEGENMLVINPEECIDCGVCEPECPAEAILPDSEAGLEKWIDLAREYSGPWPNLTRKKAAPADADDWKGVDEKFAKYFSSKPGEG